VTGAGAAVQVPLLHALLEEAPQALIVLDERGVVLGANRSAAALLRRDLGALRGARIAQLVAPADRAKLEAALAERANGRVAVELHLAAPASPALHAFELRRLDGARPVTLLAGRGPTPVSAAAAAERVVDSVLGRLPCGVLGFRGDGTVVFETAAAVRQLGRLRRRNLETVPIPALRSHVRLLLRGSRVLPPRLVEFDDGRALRVYGVGARADALGLLFVDDVSDLLRRAHAQQTFVRNAAHQLRTPLAGIAGAIEALQAGGKGDADQRDRFLAHIQRESERLSRLVRALLVLARAQSHAQPPRLEFVPVRPVLEAVAEALDVPSAVRVVVEAPPALAAFCERDLLHETLDALAQNAARHTRQGTITLRAAEREGQKLELEVADTGDGILPERQERIFDPFFRATDNAKGFGLGLAIARQAVEAMGAELDVESIPGAGSTFRVRLASARLVS